MSLTTQLVRELLRPLRPLRPLLDARHLARSSAQVELARQLDALDPAPPAVARARDLWALGILSEGQMPIGQATPQPEEISQVIRAPGAGAWTWLPADETPDWCGHFAAACLAHLPQRTRARVLASTYRLRAYGPDAGVVEVDTPRPGDIAVVGYTGGKAWGDHICLVERVDDGLLWTIEGNARGLVLGGRRGVAEDTRHGVIRRTRPMGAASRAVCPASGLQQTARLVAVYRVPS